MRLVIISDTHEKHRYLRVPEGDVLVHAGDMTNIGAKDAFVDFNNWLGDLPHEYKVVIAGNHDRLLEGNDDLARGLLSNAIYLRDSAVRIGNVHFWGSPWSPEFFPETWKFNLKRRSAHKTWALIPENTDVLVVHGPPYGRGPSEPWDRCPDMHDRHKSVHVGCHALRLRMEALPALRLLVCGHIHEGYGAYETDHGRVVNASSCTGDYKPVNPPIVIELDEHTKHG